MSIDAMIERGVAPGDLCIAQARSYFRNYRGNQTSQEFLGDLEKSAKAGTPVYELSGGAGYVWVATYNSAGRGVLRFLAIDDANIRGGGGATVIELTVDRGIFVVPVEINGAITLPFVVDSGASDVSLPADVVSTFIRTRTISLSDFVGQQTYVLADGSEVPSDVFVIKSFKVGD